VKKRKKDVRNTLEVRQLHVPYKKKEKARVFSKIQLYPQDPDIITKKPSCNYELAP
jgi:hypothetical protein